MPDININIGLAGDPELNMWARDRVRELISARVHLKTDDVTDEPIPGDLAVYAETVKAIVVDLFQGCDFSDPNLVATMAKVAHVLAAFALASKALVASFVHLVDIDALEEKADVAPEELEARRQAFLEAFLRGFNELPADAI